MLEEMKKLTNQKLVGSLSNRIGEEIKGPSARPKLKHIKKKNIFDETQN